MRKNILWVAELIIAAILLIFALFSSQVFYENSLESERASLKNAASYFTLEEYTLDEEGAKSFSKRTLGLRVTFLSSNGDVLGDSDGEILENHGDREEFKAALKAGEGYAVRLSETTEKTTVYYCKRVGDVYVRLATPTLSLWTAFGNTLPTLAWFLLLSLLVSLLVAYLETEYIISPVKKIAKQAALNQKVSTKYAELQPIVALLNERNQEVASQLKRISAEKDHALRAQSSKDDFIANITHEMNTPLTSIKGYAELLASGALNEAQTKDAAEVLLKQSDRLAKLIARIINYSELDNDDLPSYQVNASVLLEDILKGLEPNVVERNITLEKDVDEGVCIYSRQERVSELFGNLIRNAIRYNKDNGLLKVCLKRTEKGVKFSVADTGVGIAEENLGRIFDRFFTVDKSHSGVGGGFGLGLAVVKKLCNKENWKITVESELGSGTTFTVDFPERIEKESKE